MIWRVTCRIGVFWNGGQYLVGFYRWKRLAFLAAKLHLAKWPYRECTIKRVSKFDSWNDYDSPHTE